MKTKKPTTNSGMTITNVTHAGSAFGVCHGTGETVYVPAAVAIAAKVTPGYLCTADLVDNPHVDNRDKTPYMAVRVDPIVPVVPKVDRSPVTVVEAVEITRATLVSGGVWSAVDMQGEVMGSESDAYKDDSIVAYAVVREMDRMFDSGECAKFILHGAGDTIAVSEWYVVDPTNIEPMEYEDDD